MGNIVNRVFESAGPDGKVRGTPQQIIDKYQALARDAQVSGDRVAAENYLQHSEHYSRLLGEAQRQQNEQRAGQERDDTNRGEDQSEARAGGNGQNGGQTNTQTNGQGNAPREQQGGRQPRPVQGFGLTTIETDDAEADFGPIPTPESGEAQPRVTAPAAEQRPAESKAEKPRAAAPEAAPAPAEQPVAAEAPAPVDAAPAPVETPAEPTPEAAAEPAPEAKPKRPRTRRKAKVDPAPEAADAAPGEAPAEAQPAEPN